VGNGGFSLRSKRLLRALQDDAFPPLHPEDRAICRTWRDQLERRYSISFAPEVMADRFAFEGTLPNQPTFGFHGGFNVLRFVPDRLVRTLAFLDPLIERWSEEV
jgi:hypothetical protein